MRLINVYFAILGIVTVACGLADSLVTISSEPFTWGIVEFPGELFRGGWGGLVIIFAGLFYISGARNVTDIHHLANILMGSVMIWMVAGCDIFARVAESIPGGEEGWFNTMGVFLGYYAPPYTSAIILLPFSLVVIRYLCVKKG